MIRRATPEAAATATPLRSLCEGPSTRAEPTATLAGSAALVEALENTLGALFDREIALDPTHVERLLRRELVRLRTARGIKLHLHSLDAAGVQEAQQYQRELELLGELHIVLDDTLSRGGLVLVSELGEVDARRETRLAAAAARLRDGSFE